MPRRRPRLDPQVVAADDLIWEAINDLLIGDAGYKGFNREFIRRQAELRRLVNDDAWRAYLAVEEMVNARAEHVLVTVVKWAFAEGASAGRRRAGV